MSDIPKVPPQPLPGQTPPRPGAEPNASIESLPMELRTIRAALQLRGEVIQSEIDTRTREHIVRIRTPEGDIEVRFPPDEPAPKKGDRVEVEIKPGRPPEQAVVRPERSSSEPAPRPSTEAPPESAPRPSTTPVEIIVRPPPPEQSQAPAPRPAQPPVDPNAPWPQPGTTVRLQPLSPKEAAALLEAFPEIILNTIAQPVEFAAQIIATQAQEEILSQTLNIKPETIEILKTNIPLEQVITSTAPPPVLNAFIVPVSAQTTAAILPTTPAPSPAVQTANVPLTPDILQPAAPSPGSIVLTPGTTDIILRPHTIDARIETIIPPRPEIVAPGQKPQIIQTALQNIASEPAIIQNQKAGMLTGVITGTTPQSLPILTVMSPALNGSQSFTLQAPADSLVPGTMLQVTPVTLQVSPTQIASLVALPPVAQFLTPAPWPMMDDIYQSLAHIAPQAAQAMSAMTPSPSSPAQMSSAVLFFVAAARGGDITSWLGDKTIDILRRDGRGNLLSRLTQEGGLLNRLSAEPVSQDWRGMSLPLYWENEFQKIALYYRHDQQANDNDNTKGKTTRFIFDLSLSAMGKVQIDGLFRGGRLDVILRTEQHFSQTAQMDMRATYAKALKESGTTGELSFQNKPEQWVTIKAGKENFGVSA
jgi:hypothetical protein